MRIAPAVRMLESQTNPPTENATMLLVKTGRGRYRPANKLEICEEASRYQANAMIGTRYSASNPASVRAYLRQAHSWRESEAFGAIYLDNRNCVIAVETMFQGTIDGASVHPREVVKAALAHNAAAIILFHNHPSGNPDPSQADNLITARLKQALALIEVRVLDHMIVAGVNVTSMAEMGML